MKILFASIVLIALVVATLLVTSTTDAAKKPAPSASASKTMSNDETAPPPPPDWFVGEHLLHSFRSFIAPPPLSPLFQPGGALEFLNEDVAQIGIVMTLLAVIDLVVIQWLKLINDGARYYFLHIIANTISFVGSWPAIEQAILRPIGAFSGPSPTQWPNSAVAAIHIYHCVAFTLSSADLVHHALFVSILSGLAVPYKNISGVANCFGCAFLSGLPGGLDYIMLVLVKHGKMSKMKEKEYNAMINTWLRGPSMTYYAGLAWVNYINGNVDTAAVPGAILFIVAFLHFHNGALYNGQVSVSLGQHIERARVEREAAKVGGDKNKVRDEPMSPSSPVAPGSPRVR